VWDFNIHVQGEKLNSFVTFTQNVCILKCIICTRFLPYWFNFSLLENLGNFSWYYILTHLIFDTYIHGYAWDFDVHVQGVKSNSFSTFTQKCVYPKPHGNMHNICRYPMLLMLYPHMLIHFFDVEKIGKFFLICLKSQNNSRLILPNNEKKNSLFFPSFFVSKPHLFH
jgi:hypothetical protein